MPAKQSPKPAKAVTVKRVRIRRDPPRLTMDDHDGMITLQRLKEMRHSMDEVLREIGYEVDR